MEQLEQKRNRQHDFCEQVGISQMHFPPQPMSTIAGAYNRCTVTKMNYLSENVARMRKRQIRGLLDFDLSPVIFNAVISFPIQWPKTILVKITPF